MKRILATLCSFLVAAVFVVAQQDQVFMLRTADGTAVAQPKMAYATVLSFDPQARLTAERDRLKVRLTVPTSVQTVIEALAQNGAGEFVLVTSQGKLEHAGLDDGASALPPSGEEFPNEEQHAAAKQQWAEQHPEAHQRYIRSLRSATPVSHE